MSSRKCEMCDRMLKEKSSNKLVPHLCKQHRQLALEITARGKSYRQYIKWEEALEKSLRRSSKENIEHALFMEEAMKKAGVKLETRSIREMFCA